MTAHATEAAQLRTEPSGIENLKQLVRKKAQQTIERSSRLSGTSVEEAARSDDFTYGHWMSFIMVSGSAIRIMLKLHFNTRTAVSLMTAKPKADDPEKTSRMAMDFMKEQCNLIAGALKSSLKNANIITGLSIPLVTRGFDEAVFSDKIDKSKTNDVWVLRWDGGEVICSSVFEVLDWARFENFEEVEEDTDDEDDDGEFL